MYDNITQLPDLPCEADVEELELEDEDGEEHTVRALLRTPKNDEDTEFAETLEDACALYRMVTRD